MHKEVRISATDSLACTNPRRNAQRNQSNAYSRKLIALHAPTSAKKELIMYKTYIEDTQKVFAKLKTCSNSKSNMKQRPSSHFTLMIRSHAWTSPQPQLAFLMQFQGITKIDYFSKLRVHLSHTIQY